jgi:hypothetical protein
MAKSFTAKALARTRSPQKNTRAVEESPLVVLALDMAGLRGDRRIGDGWFGVEDPGLMTMLAGKMFQGRLLADFYTRAPMEATFCR